MQTIVVDTDQIRLLLADAVREAIKDELPALVQRATQKPYLTGKEVQDLTGWSRRTLQHLRDTRQIPFVQDGRKILYPTEEVRAFFEARSVRTRRSSHPGTTTR